MAGEWKTTKLGNIAIINPDIITKDWPYTYIQYIDISSVGEGLIQTAPLRLELSKAPSRAKRLVRPGDTVLSTVRPNRRSMFYVNKPADDWVVSTGFAVLRPDEQRIHPRFLYCCVFNQAFTDYLITREKGAAYPAVSPEDIANVEIPLPSLTHQRAIACILGALDDKIELNRRMNETLEQIAQAIFKKWFIEPTKNARQKDGGQGLPEGWREDSIYLAADVIYGAPFSSAKFNTKKIGKPLIRIRNLANESPDVFTPEIHPKGYLVKPGDIVVGMDGEFRAYIWGGEKSWLNQRLCVFIPKPGFSAPYVLYSITRPLAEVEATETATTVIHLGKNDIDRFKIIIAPDKILASFNRIAEPLFKRIVLNKQKSRTLAALRDSLLPKLISGELRVPDAEKICARGASALGGMEKCS